MQTSCVCRRLLQARQRTREKCHLRHCLAFVGCMDREDGAMGRLESSGGAVRRRLFHGKFSILGRNWVSLYVSQK